MKTIEIKSQRMGGLLFALFVLCLLNIKALGGNPAGDLDQGQNGGVNKPVIDPVDWINGNSNAQKSHYVEGQSIAYRLKLTDLNVQTNYVDIEYDIRKSTKATIDYITSFQRINELVNPLKGLTGTFGTPSTFPIPPPPVSTAVGTPGGLPQPITSFSSLPVSERNVTIYNGTILSINYINNADGDLGSWAVNDSSQRVRITFKTTNAAVVLAWGGHIGSQKDWGFGNSATAVPGSPFHTRFISLNGQGGNQDRGLAADAVCPPPTCAISGPTSVCTPGTSTYTAQTDGTGNAFLWSISGNGTLVGSATGSSVQVASGAPGSFTLSVTISRDAALGGCSTTCAQTVTVNPPPSCSISRLDTSTYLGPVGLANYSWTVTYGGTSVSSTTTTNVFVITDPGVLGATSLTIGLTVQADSLCTSSCVQTFSVPDCSLIVKPPASCPNTQQNFVYTGDPTNNLFLWSIVTPGSPVSIVGSNTGTNVLVTSPNCVQFVLSLVTTAQDGLQTTCLTTNAFVDTTAPNMVCAANSTIQCPGTPVFLPPTVSDLCDPNPTVTFNDVTVPGSCPQNYTVTRTWTATDACGNQNTCSQSISVVDTTAPNIVCAAVVSPIECPATPVFPAPTVSDLCDPSPTVTFTDVKTEVKCGYTVTRTWTATDACGNQSTCSESITVQDTTTPNATWPEDINLTCTDCNLDPANTGSPINVTDLCNTGTFATNYVDSITGICPKRVERRWTVSDGCNNISHVQIIQCLPSTRVVVTDSSLCSYDLDPTTACKDFRLLFTQDAQNFPQYKLTASNPGQTYFNLFYNGKAGTVVTLNLTIPYPYVTQGAQPIHAYDSVTAIPGSNGQECYIPGNGFFVNSTQVVLTDYNPQAQGSTTTVSVTLTVPASGFVYLNMHLDYGLKRTSGYARGGPSGNDAVDPTNTSNVLIPDRGTYLFAFSDGNESASDSICNMNVFKKVPGVGGLSTKQSTTYDGQPTTRVFEGCAVVLKDAKGLTLATGKTDKDGWYFCNYKWTGKATTLYVTLTPPNSTPQTKPVTIKANGYSQADFESP